MDFVEKTIKKNYVYKGKILTLRKDDALLPNGEPCIREIIEHSGGACALYMEGDKVLFVRQYRYAYGESIYELPAGKLEPHEDPMLTAKRELEEETGITAGRLELLYVAYPSPGYTDEKIYIYRAFDGEKTQRHLDEGEFVDVVWIPVDKVKNMLKNGEIKDAKTIIALQQYFING
ncbi:MAG: NUDIX hydrolase [Clostridiales bacterium]|nr:NUDIX hydrolase [Clostridiales bacterium]